MGVLMRVLAILSIMAVLGCAHGASLKKGLKCDASDLAVIEATLKAEV